MNSSLSHKIDFAVVISVAHANPNGDPQMANRPRQDADGYGVITDVCLKRKLRNRMQDEGLDIFVQSCDRTTDGFKSLQERAAAFKELAAAQKAGNSSEMARLSCERWADVRAFGSLFAFAKSKKGEDGEKSSGVSMGIRGPVTIQHAISVNPIEIEETQIVKSTNGNDVDGRASDTMGYKFAVPFGVYVAFGSINSRLAERTGFTDEDAAMIRRGLETLFENDESSARPSGSMEVLQVIWWEHESRDASVPAGRVHRSLSVKVDETATSVVDGVTISCKMLNGVRIGTMEGGTAVSIER